MAEIIARVMLNRGAVAFYDPLSNIHLTMKHKSGDVFAGTNTSNLKRGLRSGKIYLLDGSLDDPIVKPLEDKADEVAIKQEEIVSVVEAKINETQTPIETIANEVQEEVITEAKVDETADSEEIQQEELVDETEKTAKKKSSSKKSK